MPNPVKLSDVAREWCGTPFVHAGSLRGVGADCLGLVLGVLRERGYDFTPPAYAMAPGETDESALRAALEEHLVSVVDPEPGDVLLFRWRGMATHLGICTELGFVHAYFPEGRVVEVPLRPVWAARLVSAWRLPE